MRCPDCLHENRSFARFCAQCGGKLSRPCAECGALVLWADRYCDQCGELLLETMNAPQGGPRVDLTTPNQSARETLGLTEAGPGPLEGENRIVTVLFADMSGSVRTTRGLDAEDATALKNELLRAMVDAVLKVEGRVDKFLGDGVLAVFGAPVTHENDPERAILAALEVRERAESLGLQVTAGINTGPVFFGGVGGERRREITVMGTTVDLAARIQGKATAGQILVGDATRWRAREGFTFTSRQVEVKGMDEPLAVHEVTGRLSEESRLRGIDGENPLLIGREAEMALLDAALSDLREGHGRLVTLVGEAGIGKSRLVAELRRRTLEGARDEDAEREGVALPSPLWMEARCREGWEGRAAEDNRSPGGDTPFGDLIRSALGLTQQSDSAWRGVGLRALLKGWVEGGVVAESDANEMGPSLGALIGARFGTDWDHQLEGAPPDQTRLRLIRAVERFLRTLSTDRPLLIALDDLHWADSLTLDLLFGLVEVVADAPLLLICLHRPERDHRSARFGAMAEARLPGGAFRVDLRELQRPDALRLMDELTLGRLLEPEEREIIVERAQGNPFYMEEMIRSLEELEPNSPERVAWTGAPPDTVQSVILSRVDRLEPGMKRALQTAAVVGRRFRRRILEAALPDDLHLERELWGLEERGFIIGETVASDDEYIFRQALTMETVAGSLLRRSRIVLHERIGEAWERLQGDRLEEIAEPLAYHYERSGNDAKAVEALLRAGEKSRRWYLNEEALSYFLRALERLDRLEGNKETLEAEGREGNSSPANRWRLAALTGLGRLEQTVGRPEEAEKHLREALVLATREGTPVKDHARLFAWLGEALRWQNRFEEMARVGEAGLALLSKGSAGSDQALKTEEAALLQHILAVAYQRLGDRAGSREMRFRNARFLRGLPYSEGLRPAYESLIVVYAFEENDLEAAEEWLTALERQAEQSRDLRGVGICHYYATGIEYSRGNVEGALERVRRGIETYEKIGDAKLTWALDLMGQLLLLLGRGEEAETVARRALGSCERIGNREGQGQAWMTLGRVALGRGAYADARDAFCQARERFEAIEDAASVGWADRALGAAALAEGEVTLARDAFSRSLLALEPDASDAWLDLALTLGGLERATVLPSDDSEDREGKTFEETCARLRATAPNLEAFGLEVWSLYRANPASEGPLLHELSDADVDVEGSGWTWTDPLGGGNWEQAGKGQGIVVHAAPGRDLWEANVSAPRLLRAVGGDFGVEAECGAVAPESPAPAELMIWKDDETFARVGVGCNGPDDVMFVVSEGGTARVVGRGFLEVRPGDEEVIPAEGGVCLRLERANGRVKAYCRRSGSEWYGVGEAAFATEDPVEAGVAVLGAVDALAYPGQTPCGTAARFTSLRLFDLV